MIFRYRIKGYYNKCKHPFSGMENGFGIFLFVHSDGFQKISRSHINRTQA